LDELAQPVVVALLRTAVVMGLIIARESPPLNIARRKRASAA
jgi:hypothetical protein